MDSPRFFSITRKVSEEWFAKNSWTTVMCPWCKTVSLRVIVASSAVIECPKCKSVVVVNHEIDVES